MLTFYSLLKESVILQSFLTILIWGVIAYQIITGVEVSQEMLTVGKVILGFYFGSKAQYYIDHQMMRMKG